VTVAFIEGWISPWWEKVPADVNRRVRDGL
jgi:hypothetical protein